MSNFRINAVQMGVEDAIIIVLFSFNQCELFAIAATPLSIAHYEW